MVIPEPSSVAPRGAALEEANGPKLLFLVLAGFLSLFAVSFARLEPRGAFFGNGASGLALT